MRRLLGTITLVLLVATSCAGDDDYAGLTKSEATRLAKTRIERELDPTKRAYYEASIWNVATQHAETESGTPAWFVGIWNGQTDNGDCALARRSNGTNHVQLVSCARFPKYGR